MTKVLIAGATGAVGRALCEILAKDERCSQATALVRRDAGLPVDHRLVDFGDLAASSDAFAGHDIACCALGTTIAAVGGDRERFRDVDERYPLAFFEQGIAGGARQLSIVTATGANPRSPSFYNRVKGAVEEGARSLADAHGVRLTILRPGMLLTPDAARDSAGLGGKNDRLGERLAQRALGGAGFLLGPLRKRVMVRVEDVAMAMWRDALTGGSDHRVMGNAEIIEVAR